MADNANGFEAAARSISDAAANIDALVVRQLLDLSDKSLTPRVNLDDVDVTIRIIRHARPRIIYLVENSFELDSAIADLIETVSDAEEDSEESRVMLSENPMIATLNRKWRKHDGMQCTAVAEFLVDGVLHICISQPAWREEFDVELASLEEELRAKLATEEESLSKQDSKEVREKAAMLVAHPSFNAGRTSFEKRLFLAEHLFPDLDPQKLQDVTRRAESLDWLAKTGFRP